MRGACGDDRSKHLGRCVLTRVRTNEREQNQRDCCVHDTVLLCHPRGMQREEYTKAFKVFDPDDDGSITAGSLFSQLASRPDFLTTQRRTENPFPSCRHVKKEEIPAQFFISASSLG